MHDNLGLVGPRHRNSAIATLQVEDGRMPLVSTAHTRTNFPGNPTPVSFLERYRMVS